MNQFSNLDPWKGRKNSWSTLMRLWRCIYAHVHEMGPRKRTVQWNRYTGPAIFDNNFHLVPPRDIRDSSHGSDVPLPSPSRNFRSNTSLVEGMPLFWFFDFLWISFIDMLQSLLKQLFENSINVFTSFKLIRILIRSWNREPLELKEYYFNYLRKNIIIIFACHVYNYEIRNI